MFGPAQHRLLRRRSKEAVASMIPETKLNQTNWVLSLGDDCSSSFSNLLEVRQFSEINFQKLSPIKRIIKELAGQIPLLIIKIWLKSLFLRGVLRLVLIAFLFCNLLLIHLLCGLFQLFLHFSNSRGQLCRF